MRRFIYGLLVYSLMVLYIQFRLHFAAGSLVSEWRIQFEILFGALVGIVLLQIWISAKHMVYVSLFIATLLVIIMAIPFRKSLGVQLSLLIILVLLGFLRKPLLLSVSPVLILAVSLFVFYDPPTVWEMNIQDTPLVSFFGVVVFGGMILTVIWRLRYSMEKRHEQSSQLERLKGTIEELTQANLGYNTFAQFAEHNATLEERNRITRDIHDGLGYTLTNIMMLAEAAQDYDEQSVKSMLNTIRIQAKTGLHDTRQALRVLRSKESTLPRGLDAIQRMVGVFQQATGTDINLQILCSNRVVEHPVIFMTVYRFIQEALTNSFRHGHASKVDIQMRVLPPWIIISVEDNGNGSEDLQEGIGIKGMRERVESVGGELDYSTIAEPGYGFNVTVRIPIQGDDDED